MTACPLLSVTALDFVPALSMITMSAPTTAWDDSSVTVMFRPGSEGTGMTVTAAVSDFVSPPAVTVRVAV